MTKNQIKIYQSDVIDCCVISSCDWHHSGVFTVNVKQTSHLVLVL